MNKNIRVGSVFSGVGAPEYALKELGFNLDILFACDNGEIEINDDINLLKEQTKDMSNEEKNEFIKAIYRRTNKVNYVKKSYFANYNIDEKRWYEDIRFLSGVPYKNKIDLLVGGSPCQSFSIIGKRAGLEDTRGTLFYEFARLIKESQPKVFLYENVLGMLTHDGGNTWKVIQEVFNSLHYSIYFAKLNSVDFGIPQDRTRLFVVGFRGSVKDFEFPKGYPLTKTMSDFLEDEVPAKHYLGKKGFEFVTNPKYKNRARVNSKIIQTQKANQQFNWNGDFVFEVLSKVEKRTDVMERAYVSEYKGKIGVIRQLSYRECFRLMGFKDDFKIVVPNVPAYRQAGNSIVVNVLVEIFRVIFRVINEYEEN